MTTPSEKSQIDAAHAVLMEVLTILGKHRPYLVVIGGWVPSLLFGADKHAGSLDVDLAVDWRRAPDFVYQTIAKELTAAGYRQSDPPNRFEREVVLGGAKFTVIVDLLTGESAAKQGQTHSLVQGTALWCAPGVDTALDHFVEVEIAGSLPQGEANRLRVNVASAAALIVMKAMALDERMKEKDAYDLYFCLKHYPNGVDGLVAEFRAMRNEPGVQRALGLLRPKFSSLDAVGPVWAARVEQAAGGDYKIARRDAFERVNALLNALGLPEPTEN